LAHQEFKVPEGFPDILRDFTREVLRDQPKDMNRYGKPPRVCGFLIQLRTIYVLTTHLDPLHASHTSTPLPKLGYDYFMEQLKKPKPASVDGAAKK